MADRNELPLPDVLKSDLPVFEKASCWDLSTSHVISPMCAEDREHGTAFHPVGIDSVGIVYGVYPMFIDFTIMTDARSNKINGDSYLKELYTTFYDLLHILLPYSSL